MKWVLLAVIPLLWICGNCQERGGPDVITDIFGGVGSNPADIAFLLDTSTSDNIEQYETIKSFLIQFVESSNVNSGDVRFAFITYSAHPEVKFYLDRYSTQEEVINAINEASFIYGERNTADAFDLLRRKVFLERNGDRPKVPNAVLLLTTGTSNRKSHKTIQEAEGLRFAGVNIFAIGIGLNDPTEAEEIASRPTRENTFQLTSVDELSIVTDIVSAQIFTRAEQAFRSPVAGSEKLDLIFLLHFSNSIKKKEFKHVLNFMEHLLEYADVDSGHVSVGIAVYRKQGFSLYNLNRFSTKEDLVDGIRQIKFSYKAKAANTGRGLNFIRESMFVDTAGDRPNVPNAVILITDDNTNIEQAEAITEAEAVRATGAAIFAIGIGLVYPDELSALATSRDFSLSLGESSELADNVISFQDKMVALRTEVYLPSPFPSTTTSTTTTKTTTAPAVVLTIRPPPSVVNREEADVVLAFHCSKRTPYKHFKKGLLAFFSEIVSAADVNSGAVKFALVGYGQDADVIFDLKAFKKKNKLLKALKRVKASSYRFATANTTALISKITTEVFDVTKGDRPGVPNIIIFVTDSPPSVPVSDIKEKANILKKSGTSIFAIGIGKADPMEITEMASEPSAKFSYKGRTFPEIMASADLKDKLSETYKILEGLGSSQIVSPTRKPKKKKTTLRQVVTERSTVAQTRAYTTVFPATKITKVKKIPKLETATVYQTFTPSPVSTEVTTGDHFSSRTVTSQNFVTPPLSGSEEADIVFAVHVSDRTSNRNVRTILNYLNMLVSGADVETGRVQIGLLAYGADAEVIFHLNQYGSVPQIRNEISRTENRVQSRDVDASAALVLGTQMLDYTYSRRQGVPKALIFVTDSDSTENAELIPFEKFRIESEQVNVFSIGIEMSGKEELESLSTAPENVITVSRYSELPATMDDMKRKIFAFRTRDEGSVRVVPTKTEPAIVARTNAPPRQEGIGITLVAQPSNPCADAQVDMVIILDASTSVTEPNFMKMLDFCKELLADSDIDNGNVQVGVLVYSTNVVIEFHLNRYKTRVDVLEAIGNITYIYGSTNTADGLMTMREQMFSYRNGDRSNVQNVAVILTDGVSNVNSRRTIPEAELSRMEGIHIYALGIGLSDTRELDAIASEPASENSFNVESFDQLKGIEQKIFAALCPVLRRRTTTPSDMGKTRRRTTARPTTPKPTTRKPTTPKPTTPKPTTLKPTTPKPTTPTTTTPAPRRDGYDLVIVLDSSVNSRTFNWMMRFVKDIIREISIDDEEWRVGILTYSTSPYRQFHLNEYNTKSNVLRRVGRITYRPGQTNTAAALKYARTRMFKASNGDRDFAKNYLILITGNERSLDMYAAANEAYQMQRDGVGTFVIGLGVNDKTELDELASLPLADYQLIIPDPNQMGEFSGQVIYNIKRRAHTPNPPPERPRPRTTTPKPSGPVVCKSTGDIVFILDSSGSVGQENFYRVLNFTYQTIDELDIDSGNFKVGVVSFSNSARINFYLSTYKKREEIKEALFKIPYVYGSTHTAAALRRVRLELLRPQAGDRSDVPNVVVIITDGQSNINHEMTLPEANRLKRAGVSLITVAVGFQRQTTELLGLTSAPVKENLIYADNYESLGQLTTKLVEPLCTDSNLCRNNPCRNGALCVDGIRSYICLCSDSFYGTNCEKQCGEPADVAFVLDSSNTVGQNNFQMMKDYVEFLIQEMNIEACDINIGLMKYSSAAMVQWGLGEHRDTETNIRALYQVHYTKGVANMAAAFAALRLNIFSGRGGDRREARNIAYFLTDGSNMVHPADTQVNAELAINSGIRIIPVGVSLRDREEVDLIAGAQGLNTIIISEGGPLNLNLNDAALAPMVKAKDYCAGNPCKNGAKCVNESFGYRCDCLAGFTGDDCSRRCSARGDVVFAVDASRYVTRKEMKRVRRFLRSVVKRLRFKEFKVGLVQYSSTAHVRLTFAEGDRKKTVLSAISGLRNMVGNPDAAEALAKANFRIFKGNGAMKENPDYLVLLSKGLNNEEELIKQSNVLKMKGTRILGVGIGLTNSEKDLMESVASYPASETVYNTDDVNGLGDLADSIVEFMCNGKDKCAQNPCQNRGKCRTIGAEYYCDCPVGFAGKNCELRCDARGDVVFLLDSSGSVGHTDFRKMKQFVYNMINDLNIGKEHTRVGLVSYSSKSRHGFYLDDYYEKYQLQNAISGIGFEYGNTNTADGLKRVREKLFNANVGDRPDAQDFVVVITDGLSNVNPDQTLIEADLLKARGAHVYAIGIGNFDRYEIDGIASAPADLNAYILDNYSALDSISSDIIRATCRDPTVCDENPCRNDGACVATINGPVCECAGGFRGQFCEMRCVMKKDIIFVLDSSTSVGPENFQFALEFVSALVEELIAKGNDNRFGMITFSTDVQLVFSLGRYRSADIVHNAIRYTRYKPGSTNTAAGLRTAIEISSQEYGDRASADNILILIADGQSNINAEDTMPAAEDLKRTGAKVITIGVGLSDYQELEQIASTRHDVFRVNSYSLLGGVKADIMQSSCSLNEEEESG